MRFQRRRDAPPTWLPVGVVALVGALLLGSCTEPGDGDDVRDREERVSGAIESIAPDWYGSDYFRFTIADARVTAIEHVYMP